MQRDYAGATRRKECSPPGSCRRRETGGDGTDALAAWSRAYQDWWMSAADAYQSMLAPWTEPFARPRRKPCRAYDPCLPDRCHCECCIGDADVVIYGHVGERRVAPITIANMNSFKRTISPELAGFSTRGGAPCGSVKGILNPDQPFELGACEEKTILLMVALGAPDRTNVTAEVDRASRDVDRCEVCYSDLRLPGCDVRPVRIAVAVLPYDCDAYRVECRCACCC